MLYLGYGIAVLCDGGGGMEVPATVEQMGEQVTSG